MCGLKMKVVDDVFLIVVFSIVCFELHVSVDTV
jgi:hypothetical protein